MANSQSKRYFCYFFKLFILIFSLSLFSFAEIKAQEESEIQAPIKKNIYRNCSRTASEDLNSYLEKVQFYLKKEYGVLIRDYFHEYRGVISNHRETYLETKIKIDQTGKVGSVKITRSSKEEALDQLIIDLILNQSPLPVPERICDDILNREILVKFTVNNTTFKQGENNGI